LGDLYYSTNGFDWTGRAGWAAAAAGIPTDYCDESTFTQWDYASPEREPVVSTICDNNGMVTKITLNSNNLSGTIPASLGSLTSLVELCVCAGAVLGCGA
jgi:hypothetical protein